MDAGTDLLSDEERQVADWRFAELLRIGLPSDDAQWASYADVSVRDLERLVARGCDPLTALRILA